MKNIQNSLIRFHQDGHSSKTNCDQDSDISFMNDTDEEMDTAVTEEEDWIETHEKKHSLKPLKQTKTTKNPMLDQKITEE